MKIMKLVKDEEFWPRLLLDKMQEKLNVKIDWAKYVDEDEADGKELDTGTTNPIACVLSAKFPISGALDGGMDFGGNAHCSND